MRTPIHPVELHLTVEMCNPPSTDDQLLHLTSGRLGQVHGSELIHVARQAAMAEVSLLAGVISMVRRHAFKHNIRVLYLGVMKNRISYILKTSDP